MAEAMAVAAVWPRPQIEASRMTVPTSARRASSSADARPAAAAGHQALRGSPPGGRSRPGRGRTARRTRPGRTRRCAAGSRPGRRVSSSTMTTPEPSVAPAARAPSKVRGMSSRRGRRTAPAAPPSSTACSAAARQAGRRPVEQVRERDPEGHLVDARAARPSRRRQNSFVPVERSVPMAAKAAAAVLRMGSTLTSVSTLLTTVGLPKSPTSTGNGGLLRGSPR